MDVFSKRKRSEVMSRIRGKGNRSTELAFLLLLRRSHLSGWRRHKKIMSVTPDFVFEKKRIAIFLDGCFWHGCRICGAGRIPKNNRQFWLRKIRGNMLRDKRSSKMLKRSGWTVIRFWEHVIVNRPKWIATKIAKSLN